MNKYECENCSLFIHDEKMRLWCPYVSCNTKFMVCDSCFQKLLFGSSKPYILRSDTRLFTTHSNDQHKAVDIK